MQSIRLFNHMEIQLGYECLVFLLLGLLKCITGLRCYECLYLTCDSPVICESIKLSMQDPLFYPKPMHIEFAPDTTCPTTSLASAINNNSSQNSSLWTNFSHECPVQDSACLEATIEITTTFNGLKNSLELDPHSTLSSKGYIRACASRKYLKSRIEPTITYKDESISNVTLSDISKRLGVSDKSNYVITEIHSHEFYIDQGTEDSVTCYQDNCNYNTRRNARNDGNNLITNTNTHMSLTIAGSLLVLSRFGSW